MEDLYAVIYFIFAGGNEYVTNQQYLEQNLYIIMRTLSEAKTQCIYNNITTKTM